MTLSSLFNTRFGRIAILTFTVISVVATSDPGGWAKDATTPAETVTIAPGATLTRKIAFDASQNGEVDFYIDGTTDPNAHLSITSCATDLDSDSDAGAAGASAADAGPDTSSGPLVIEREGNAWNDPQEDEPSITGPIGVGNCRDLTAPSTVEMNITNIGSAATTLTWHAYGYIEAPDDEDDAPPGARVSIAVTP